MNRLHTVKAQAAARKHRVRKSINSSADRPRLSVHISHRHIVAQIIDDTKHKTIVYSTTVGQKQAGGTMTEKAQLIGTDIAKKAKVAKVKQVVLDRGSHLYHGRLKALADAARTEGLEF